MVKSYWYVFVSAFLAVFVTACGTLIVQAGSTEGESQPKADYRSVLGRSLSDKEAENFIAVNDCSSSGPLQLCMDAGLSFWVDPDQILKQVYLSSGNESGFSRYRGKLPFGLTFYDPMWLVQDKLANLNEGDSFQTTENDGSPDEAGSPDHLHYWAVYKQLGMTVIYDTPFADEDAYIYAIVLNSN